MRTNVKGRDFATSSFLSNHCSTGESSTIRSYENYVPLDYLKAEIVGVNADLLLNNHLLSFTRLINEETGEIEPRFNRYGEKKKPCRIAKYKNLIFLFYPESGYFTISGSLHAFYNDGKHNANDFDIIAFDVVLKRLYALFGLMPQNLKIIQLEWGVNLKRENVNQIIKHCLYVRTIPFERVYDSVKGKYWCSELTEYKIKVYNKGLHFALGYDILRVERHQKDWAKYCKRHKIGRTLKDLIDSRFLGLKKTLTDSWLNILFFDPFIPEHETELIQYRDPIKWEKLRANLTRPGVKKHRDKLRKANREKGADLQRVIGQEITEKISVLNREKLTFPNFSYFSKTLTPILFIHYGIEPKDLRA